MAYELITNITAELNELYRVFIMHTTSWHQCGRRLSNMAPLWRHYVLSVALSYGIWHHQWLLSGTFIRQLVDSVVVPVALCFPCLVARFIEQHFFSLGYSAAQLHKCKWLCMSLFHTCVSLQYQPGGTAALQYAILLYFIYKTKDYCTV